MDLSSRDMSINTSDAAVDTQTYRNTKSCDRNVVPL